MACFLVPATEAVVTTIVQKVVKTKEENAETKTQESKIQWSRKLGWLNKMLWGGSALLALEHLWHGEVTPFFPFLTAMENAGDTIAMLHEMATIGTSMAALVTVVWGILTAVVSQTYKKSSQTQTFCIDAARQEK